MAVNSLLLHVHSLKECDYHSLYGFLAQEAHQVYTVVSCRPEPTLPRPGGPGPARVPEEGAAAAGRGWKPLKVSWGCHCPADPFPTWNLYPGLQTREEAEVGEVGVLEVRSFFAPARCAGWWELLQLACEGRLDPAHSMVEVKDLRVLSSGSPAVFQKPSMHSV